MIKTLQQIQEENRRAIAIKIYVEDLIKSYFDEWQEIVKFYFPDRIDENRVDLLASEITLKIANRRLSLDKVLLALIDYSINISQANNNCIYFCNSLWDLTKQTLEEQSEEVQRSINKILMGND